MSERLQQIYSALSAADKAGNTEDAQNLANAYKIERDKSEKASGGMQPFRSRIKPPTDNAFQYSVDQAQRMGGKGLEALGRATQSPQIENYGTSVVKQQDGDISKGGYKPSYTKSLRDTFNEDGLSSAMGWLGEKTAENSVSGGAALIGGVASAAVASVSAPAAAVIGLTTLAGSAAMGAGEAAFEQEDKVGDYDSSLAVGQGIIIGILDKFGAGKVIPKSKLMSMTTKEITDELSKKGYTQAAKEILQKTAVEGATEVAQEGVSMAGAASRGGEYTNDEVLDRGIESFALGSTNAGIAQGVMGTGNAIVNGTPASLSDRAAQATFAQRLDTLQREGDIDGNPFDLSDLDTTSETGVRALVDAAHRAIDAEIKTKESDLKPFLDPNDKSLNSQQKADRIKVINMLKQARNKTKSVVGAKDFALLKKLVGDTPDGQRLINLVKESQEQTKVWNAGMVGGVSKYTDLSNPIPSNTNYSGQQTLTNSIKGLGTGGLAYTSGGASLIPQAAIFAGGRLIDKATGRRSKVRRYIDQNKGGDAFSEVSGTGQRDITRAEMIQAGIDKSIERERVAQEKLDEKELKAQEKASEKERKAQDKASEKAAKEQDAAIEKDIVAQEKAANKEINDLLKAAEKTRKKAVADVLKEQAAQVSAGLKAQKAAASEAKAAKKLADTNKRLSDAAAAKQATLDAKAAKASEDASVAADIEALRVETTRSLTQENAPAQKGSPQYIVEKATGLNRSGVARVLRIIKSNASTKRGVRIQIAKYEKSVDTGGLIDFEIIRKINVEVDKHKMLKALMVAPRDAEIGTQAINTQVQVIRTQKDINYQAGIDSNRLVIQELDSALKADNKISIVKKGILISALSNMGKDLGKNPIGKLQEIEANLLDQGISQEQMEMYFKPYLDRVLGQQRPVEQPVMQEEIPQ